MSTPDREQAIRQATDPEPRLYTKWDFLKLAGAATAGAALAASIPGSTARGDGTPTPEGPRLLCEDPYFKNNPEVKIGHTHLIGMVVGFPDQPEGVAAVERSDSYHDGMERQLATANGFFKRFMKINVTYEVQREPRFLMSRRPYAEYIARRIEGIRSQDVDLPEIYYDGNRYPIFVLMYVATRDHPRNLEYPGTRGSYITFNNSRRDRAGKVTIPWLLAERESEKYVLWHEIGHAYGMPHNPDNPKSLMALGTNVSRLLVGFEQPVLDSYDLANMCPSYGPNYTRRVFLSVVFGPRLP